MYLTIALIVLVPVSVRVYRYLTMKQTKRMLHEQFGRQQDAHTNKSAEQS